MVDPPVGGHIYRGGAPPDLAPFSADRSGCRGFTGPVPPPLWMRFTGDRPGNASGSIVAGSRRPGEDGRPRRRHVGMHPTIAYQLVRTVQDERLARARHADLIRE